MQTAYMPATATAQQTWRPRIDPSNISSANASMPPRPPGYQGPWPPPYPPGYPGPPPAQLPPSLSAHQWSKGHWRFDPKATGWSSASGAPPQPPPQQQQQYYNPSAINNNVPRPSSQQAGGPPGWGQNWVAHGWQMPADHNPYKRMPKEPDPSYFAVALSENPLGLENMHITRESRPQAKPFTTPWRWVPEDLPPSDEEEDESTPPTGHQPSSRNNPNSTQNQPISSASQQATGYPPHFQQPGSQEAEQYRSKSAKTSPPYSSSRRGTQEYTPPKESSLYRSSSRRHAQEYTPPSDSSPHRSSSRRRPEEYTPPSDDQRRPSIFSRAHAHGDRSRRDREREREKDRDRRKSSDSDEQENEAFSGKKELHPTFSPAIVRTPNYYLERTGTPNNSTPTKSSSTRRASDGPGAPHYGAVLPSLNRVLQESAPAVLSPLVGISLDKISRGELSSSSSSSSPSSKDRSSRTHSRNHSRSNSLSKVDDKTHRPLQRSDTVTSRTMSPTRYDERPNPPTHYTSSSSSAMQQPSRTVGRSQTFPYLEPVSENPYSSSRWDSRNGRESRNPPTSISRASDAAKDPTRSSSRTVGRSYTDPQPYPNPTRTTSPSRARSPIRALSPPRSATPSRSSSRVPSRSHTPTSSAVIVPPVPVPALPVDASHRYRTSSAPGRVSVRAGYWNKRGDCLAHDRKYFVRAPPEHQYPREFSRYPDEGFYRYDGKRFSGRTENLRECPDSLPVHGRPAKRPFASYLQFTEVNPSEVWRPY